MNLLNLQQGSPEWLHARLGVCTGSRVRDALSKLKNGNPSQKRRDYMTDLVSERLTGCAVDHYITPAMEHGIVTEPHARAAYEAITGNDVDKVGIAAHSTIEGFLSSPDGFVDSEGVTEFKCPTTTTHIEWMIDDVLPEEHELQCLSHLSCTGRQWVDWMSFDPRLPPKHQYFIKRMWRKDVEEKIAAMEQGVREFLAELDAMVKRLEER